MLRVRCNPLPGTCCPGPVGVELLLSRQGSRHRLQQPSPAVPASSSPETSLNPPPCPRSSSAPLQGHITEKDLEAFANRNGLPGSYAQHFVSAVLSSHNGSTQTSAQPTGAGKLRGGGAAEDVDHSEDVELTFALFKNFVRSREDALRRAFNMFDQGERRHGQRQQRANVRRYGADAGAEA